jgi:hypothetical protein
MESNTSTANNHVVTDPAIKLFTKAELRNVSIPDFQRWIDEPNLRELKLSVSTIGMLRCPVIYYVKERNETYIIDGNHLRTIIVENDSLPENLTIACIYQEVKTFSEAAKGFKFLNTKGKALDWINITNLYMHVNIDKPSCVYRDIWRLFLGSPTKESEVVSIDGFSVPTIVEFLCKNKKRYREGDAVASDTYIVRKNLLTYLTYEATNGTWNKRFSKVLKIGGRRPSGTAINGFANYWFNKGCYTRYKEGDFINFVVDIYTNKAAELNSGKLVILRDNAYVLMKEYMEKLEGKAKPVSKKRKRIELQVA